MLLAETAAHDPKRSYGHQNLAGFNLLPVGNIVFNQPKINVVTMVASTKHFPASQFAGQEQLDRPVEMGPLAAKFFLQTLLQRTYLWFNLVKVIMLESEFGAARNGKEVAIGGPLLDRVATKLCQTTMTDSN